MQHLHVIGGHNDGTTVAFATDFAFVSLIKVAACYLLLLSVLLVMLQQEEAEMSLGPSHA